LDLAQAANDIKDAITDFQNGTDASIEAGYHKLQDMVAALKKAEGKDCFPNSTINFETLTEIELPSKDKIFGKYGKLGDPSKCIDDCV
jgi:hypothetical protein